jgi:hypothetical protein
MAAIRVHPNWVDCWPEIALRKKIDLLGSEAAPIQLALIPGGMSNGESSLVIRIDLPDGQVVLTQASLPSFLEAAKALEVAEATFRRDLVMAEFRRRLEERKAR